MKKKEKYFYIFTPIVLGGIASLITGKNMNIDYLIKPPLTPPALLFPIVWSVLYLGLGYSYYLYKKNGVKNTFLEKVYYTNNALNFLWTILFFKLKLRFIAIIDIVLLLTSNLVLLKEYYKSNKISTYINIPYTIWVSFATYLTIAFYILNK